METTAKARRSAETRRRMSVAQKKSWVQRKAAAMNGHQIPLADVAKALRLCVDLRALVGGTKAAIGLLTILEKENPHA
jgi:predicted transcriptional regulator of viral defense system